MSIVSYQENAQEVAAAMRAARTKSRQAWDAGMALQIARAGDNPEAIQAARQAFHQAREVDLRSRWNQFFGGISKNSGLSGIGSSAIPFLGTIGLAMGVYHGYQRTHDVPWTIGWALFGSILAPIAIPVMFIQGFGKPA